MAKKTKINVSIAVAAHDDLTKVANVLKTKGFVLKETMEAIGVLTGSAPADTLEDLSKVLGVLAVEKERTDYHTQ